MIRAALQSSDRSREFLPGGGGGCGGGGGSPSTHLSPRIVAAGWNSGWACLLSCGGSPGPGEREDVFRVSLIMAASEEINRQGPAGMLQQLLPLTGGKGQRRGGGRERRRCGGGGG